MARSVFAPQLFHNEGFIWAALFTVEGIQRLVRIRRNEHCWPIVLSIPHAWIAGTQLHRLGVIGV